MSSSRTVHKLTQLLTGLDKREWAWLDKFVRSPYHKGEERLTHLLNYYHEGQLARPAAVYARLYPGEAYDERRWRAAQRLLLKLVEEFFLQQELRRQPVQAVPLRVQAYARRQFPQLAIRQAEAGLERLKEEPLPRWELAELRLRLTRAIYQSPAGQRKREELNLILHELQLHYLLLQLRYGVDLLARGITFDESIETLEYLQPLVERLRPGSPLLDFYYRIYEAYERADQPDGEELLALEKLYYARYADLHADDRTFWLVKLCNLFNRATQAGLAGFRAHLFRVYRFGIDERLTLVNGRLMEVSFINLVSLGTAVGELAWVADFRAEFLPLLAIPDTYNAAQISAAYLHYHRHEHEEVHACLKTLQRPSLLHQLYARPLELQSLLTRYLQDDSLVGVLRSRLDTFYRWVYRDRRIAPSRKAEFQQFAKIIRLIVRVKEKRIPSAEARQQLHQAIETGPGMIAHEWVLSVVDRL